jgi:hypothetical protein
VNESLWPGRRPAEFAECHLHEALLDQAVSRTPALWLRCPYDVARLHPAVLHEAVASHPIVWENDAYRVSGSYGGSQAVETMFRGTLPEPAAAVVEMSFGASRLSVVGDLVGAHAVGAGVDHDLVDALVLAVQELAASRLRQGPGAGTLSGVSSVAETIGFWLLAGVISLLAVRLFQAANDRR